MAFGLYFLTFAVFCKCVGSQNGSSTEFLQEITLEEVTTSQTIADNVSIPSSTAATYTNSFNRDSEAENTSLTSTNVPTTWQNDITTYEQWIPLKEKTLDLHHYPLSSPQPDSETSSSDADVTYFSETSVTDFDKTITVNESTTTTLFLPNQSESNGDAEHHLNPDASNLTVSPDGWSNTYSPPESRGISLNSSSDLQEDILILLRANCSIVNREKNPLTVTFAEVGCAIYLRINVSLENGTRDIILNSLEKLTIKPSDFQIVEAHEDADRNKQEKYHYLLSPETLAYLAIPCSLAFILLLAAIVFGFRCFKKRKPSLDVSAFDAKLSSYSLTKIPRASLTSVDLSPESDCLDDITESPSVASGNCRSCESGLDVIPCDTFSRNRGMKTFGVSRNTDSPSDMYPHHNAIAYENHTFQRYF